ncbi:MAG: YicC family protein [Bacteroidales bacterium]|jgi:uncharacterized protein (TIGR00255 family)|nr:YicC family protein [Bacteroidales bacterium]MDD3272877.1 YicC family protein [Bacteroidales bacterium]MDD4057955.1 YicC family protein [Bacteroidales bacterium]
MLKSMTGFGKSETITTAGKISVEIRSVNGKNADINFKTQYIPREKEIETKQMLSTMLGRGSIDLYISIESSEESIGKHINQDVFQSYWRQITQLCQTLEIQANESDLLPVILKMPDVIESNKPIEIEAYWPELRESIINAAKLLNDYRSSEGANLEQDLRRRVSNIQNLLSKTERLDSLRSEAVRGRILSRFADSGLTADENRFEQELIYYLEKLDITEEKVRLKQHCDYFLETIEKEEMPGKKLGFISQEIGREINTLGSKANFAEIQKIVVEMKEELEKIKEQSLNIL